MKVTVTERDIQKARTGPRNGGTCPIARALVRQLSDGRGSPVVQVGPLHVSINATDHKLPEVARDFVATFDADGLVKPFTFTLEN